MARSPDQFFSCCVLDTFAWDEGLRTTADWNVSLMSTGFSFGQSANQNNNQTSGLFGQSSSNSGLFGSQQLQSGSLFGQNQSLNQTSNGSVAQPQFSGFGQNQTNSGSLFGQTQPSVFGQPAKPAQTGGLFGQAAAPKSGSLFGQNTGQQSGGLLGQTSNASPNTSLGQQQNTQPGGLFGQTANQQPGSLFGQTMNQNVPAQTGGSLFGQANQKIGSLFGQNQTQSISAQPGSFNGQSNQAGGFFGQSAPQQNQAQSSGLFGGGITGNSQQQGGLFGQKPAGGASLFGQQKCQESQFSFGKPVGNSLFQATPAQNALYSNTPDQNQNQQTFMNQNSANLFSSIPSQNLFNSAPTAQPRFIKTIGASSLPDVPPPKLYSSLMSSITDQPKSLNTQSGSNGHVPENNTSSTTVKRETNTIPPEARQWINSYEQFLSERPTNLIMRREPAGSGALPWLARSAPTTMQHALKSNFETKSTGLLKSLEAPMQTSDYSMSVEDPEISLFHRLPRGTRKIHISREAIEQGYYIQPSVEELSEFTRAQLRCVSRLIIGREGYGQIEYPEPVDLSQIDNLGDLLGILVIFDRGTVCVYPDESNKPPVGMALNVPCTVTIENAWPRDSNLNLIKDMKDPRMARHCERLREASESRGGEFVTFAQGIWVFKVPHFSIWGLPAEEMVVDDLPVEPSLIKSMEQSSVSNESVEMNAAVADATYQSEPRSWADLLNNPNILPPADPHKLQRILLGDAREEYSNVAKELQLPSNGVFRSRSSVVPANSPSGVVKSRSLETAGSHFDFDFSQLYPRTKHVKRENSAFPLLKTTLYFSDLSRLAPHPAWDLARLLFDPELSAAALRKQLSDWLEKRVEQKVKQAVLSAPSELDAAWAYLTGRKLAAAAARAVAANCPHLATIIAQLGFSRVADNAKHQLDDWRASGALGNVPKEIRRVYELAAGKPDLSNLDYERSIGLQLWYSDTSIDFAIQNSMMSLDMDESNMDLVAKFLRLYIDHSQLASVLVSLSPVHQFLAIQALPDSVTDDARRGLIDCAHYQLALELLATEQSRAAPYVALHITDEALASATLREVLLRIPNLTIDESVAKFGIPVDIRKSIQAIHLAAAGQFRDAASALLDCRRDDEAHSILVSDVAPEAVISGTLDLVLPLLLKVSPTVPGWTHGAKIYIDFAEFCERPTAAKAISLSNSLKNILDLYSERPRTMIVRRGAAAEMAAVVASRSDLTTKQILNLPLGSSELILCTLNRCAEDLAGG